MIHPFLLASAMLAAVPAPAAPQPAVTSFDSLKALVGTWRARRASGRGVEVAYRLTAGDSVLTETWTLSPTRESITVYHRDGRDLLATHYCLIGNQPRLRLASSDPRRLRFRFKDATDVGAGESHLHAFGIDLLGPDRLVRTETYRENGKPETETLLFERVRP